MDSVNLSSIIKQEAVKIILDSIQGVANCGCDQLKTDKGIADIFAGFQAMYTNRILDRNYFTLTGEVGGNCE